MSGAASVRNGPKRLRARFPCLRHVQALSTSASRIRFAMSGIFSRLRDGGGGTWRSTN